MAVELQRAFINTEGPAPGIQPPSILQEAFPEHLIEVVEELVVLEPVDDGAPNGVLLHEGFDELWRLAHAESSLVTFDLLDEPLGAGECIQGLLVDVLWEEIIDFQVEERERVDHGSTVAKQQGGSPSECSSSLHPHVPACRVAMVQIR